MAKVTPDNIRTKVMQELGVSDFKQAKKQRRIRPVPRPVINHQAKTPLMRYLELVHGQPIEDILLTGSLSIVAKKLDNEVDVTTISKWIKKLKLRYSKDNLPVCEGCSHYGPACNSGICYILMELELYDLVLLKKAEVMNE